MNLQQQIKAAPQKELMQVLGLSRPLISDIQNDKRPLTTVQHATLEDYFTAQQSGDLTVPALPALLHGVLSVSGCASPQAVGRVCLSCVRSAR